MSNLRLAFILEAIDKATGPLRRISQAVDKLHEPAKRVSRSWGDVSERGGKLRESVQGVSQVFGAVTLAAGGAFYAMKRTIDEVDRANDQAKMLSMTTEQYQRMGYAAQLNGSSQESMGEALKFLNENMTQAISGNKEAALWFARVGIPIEKLKKMNAGEVFETIADKFQSVGDAGQNAANKIAVTKALMGRGGTEMKQVLDQGSEGLRTFYKEADRVGAVVGNSTATAMADFNDNFDRLKFSIFGVMAAIVKAALPALDSLVKKFTEMNIASREEWGRQIGETVSKIVEGIPSLLKGLGKAFAAIALMATVAQTVADAFGGWENVIYIVSGLLAMKLAVGVFSLTAAFIKLIPTVWGLGTALMATPLGWFMLAIAAIVGLVVLIYKNWEPIKQFFADLWGGVKASFMAVYDWIAGKIGGFLNLIEKITSKVKGMFASAPSQTVSMEYDAFGNPTGTLASSALPDGANRTDVGGTLKIQIDQDGRARVAKVENNNKNVDFEVYSGMSMVTP